ncbi:hypothetical protein FHS56_000328 [Thermonema lapsum]|uniref:Lipocalin-like domain-containing protein n=1 Tax=Thermonema lapsum TaxID=28195 RepID=A0A846MN56_9BACT|nr:hypothetical protein [Thermonema lapsum]NIK72842.1 hypothetical protein [Thermonema lapsum]
MMKKVLYTLLWAALIGLTACYKPNPLPSPTPKDLIQGTWLLGSVSITENGLPVQDVTAYNGFLLKIEGFKYYVNNGNEAFPQDRGEWGFVDETYKQIRLGDGTIIEVTTLNADTFSFTFERKGSRAARNNIVPTRVFTFTLKK